jgi:hypothetical protein
MEQRRAPRLLKKGHEHRSQEQSPMLEALTALLADPEAHQFSWQNGELYIASAE